MPSYLLRMEAVNFDASCYDTEDLSTIRGGSMLLMNAHKLIETNHSLGEPTVYGASQAIWKIEAADDEAAEATRRQIEFALAEHEELRHCTLVVDVAPASDDSAADLQRLRTLNRWRQFQQPTLAVPDKPAGPPRGGRPYCDMDMVRPASVETWKGDDIYHVSTSVSTRRKYGKDQKEDFYGALNDAGLAFANDLDAITSRKDMIDDDRSHLNGKMAVLYLDGDQQGEMTTKLGLDQLTEFRKSLRSYQEAFLTSVLAEIAADIPSPGESNDWFHWHKKEHQVRFETLLWGGDDIVLVVPAWKGWELVGTFFNHLTGKATAWMFDEKPLRYSAGVVFCSHKASIHRMRGLADTLLKQAKKEGGNGLAYEVLESFDVVGADLPRWQAAKLGSDAAKDDDEQPPDTRLFLHSSELSMMTDMVHAVHAAVDDPKIDISRRQIEKLARAMRTHPMSDENFKLSIEKYLDKIPAFKNCGELGTRQKLYHLVSLWDYVR